MDKSFWYICNRMINDTFPIACDLETRTQRREQGGNKYPSILKREKTTEVKQFLFWEYPASVVLQNKGIISTY